MLTRKTSKWLFTFLVMSLFVLTSYSLYVHTHQLDNTQSITLKVAHGSATSHPTHLALLAMNESLQKLSHGQLSLTIYPSSVLGSNIQAIQQMQQGVLAMAQVPAAELEPFVDEMQAFGLPYVFKDRAQYWRVLDSTIGDDLLLTLQAKNLHGLAWYDAGSRSFYSTKKQIKFPQDLHNMKVRVMNSRTAIKMVTAMGGAATPISFGELYTALAQGTVDAAENNPPSYVANRHYEVSPYFTFDEHTRAPDMVIMSKKIWLSLSKQQQRWLKQAAEQSSKFQRQLWQQKTKKAIAEATAKGVTFYYPDTEAFYQKIKPMYDDYADTAVGNLIKQIQDK